MSSNDKPADTDDEVCASCGIKGDNNNVKLKTCTACKLVKYCSVECQRKHRSSHKKACRKRAAELRDELLFKQPECTYLGECPICFVPIPSEADENSKLTSAGHNVCCGKIICSGCSYESRVQGLEQNCPFCRTLYPKNKAEVRKMIDKQLKRGNRNALRCQADDCRDEGNYNEAIKYYVQAAKGGDAESHRQLGRLFSLVEGVQKDLKKAIWHYEEASIGGHPDARAVLGTYELSSGNTERAVKHWIIGAKLGSKEVLDRLMKGYKDGNVSLESFHEGLRGYQEAVNATKTPQREVAMQNPHVVCTSEEIWSKSAKLQNLSKVAKLR